MYGPFIYTGVHAHGSRVYSPARSGPWKERRNRKGAAEQRERQRQKERERGGATGERRRADIIDTSRIDASPFIRRRIFSFLFLPPRMCIFPFLSPSFLSFPSHVDAQSIIVSGATSDGASLLVYRNADKKTRFRILLLSAL